MWKINTHSHWIQSILSHCSGMLRGIESARETSIYVRSFDCSCLYTLSSTSTPAQHVYVCGALCIAHSVVNSNGRACIGSRVNVGGAVYVHPIRILFYDRRVIMCAVMLNSTYRLWNVLSLSLFESLIILLRHFWRWLRLLLLCFFILIYIFECSCLFII